MIFSPKYSKIRFTYFLAFFTSVTFVTSILLTFYILTTDKCPCDGNPNYVDNIKISHPRYFDSKHKLAILVPFRDRFDELLIFAPYLHSFLSKQHINHDIFILNQIDNYRFNRASLINIGFSFTKNSHDYIAMHDVDLLPLNPKLKYVYPKDQPLHIAAPNLHPKYHYPTFVGGILLVNREQFQQVNGMSNKYWGWGLEDDEFYVRLKEVGLNITRPVNIDTDSTNLNKLYRGAS